MSNALNIINDPYIIFAMWIIDDMFYFPCMCVYICTRGFCNGTAHSRLSCSCVYTVDSSCLVIKDNGFLKRRQTRATQQVRHLPLLADGFNSEPQIVTWAYRGVIPECKVKTISWVFPEWPPPSPQKREHTFEWKNAVEWKNVWGWRETGSRLTKFQVLSNIS